MLNPFLYTEFGVCGDLTMILGNSEFYLLQDKKVLSLSVFYKEPRTPKKGKGGPAGDPFRD